MKIPSLILKQLYTMGSLENVADGVRFGLKNRLSDAKVTAISGIAIDGRKLALADVTLDIGGEVLAAGEVTTARPIALPLRRQLTVICRGQQLESGKHTVGINFEASPFGKLAFEVADAIREHAEHRVSVPCDKENNYAPEIIRARQEFVAELTGAKLEHVASYSFDPERTKGNIENFTGVAQVPIGFAGPLRINGEHAQGEFLIPLATTEGTLVASYNRGMKVLNLSGGVTCTVSDDRMQRAPVFVFDSAREARDFRDWVDGQHGRRSGRRPRRPPRSPSCSTSTSILSNKFAYLRFNFSTGDAAGQNMVGRATFAACSWILEHASTPCARSSSSRTSRPTRRPPRST